MEDLVMKSRIAVADFRLSSKPWAKTRPVGPKTLNVEKMAFRAHASIAFVGQSVRHSVRHSARKCPLARLVRSYAPKTLLMKALAVF